MTTHTSIKFADYEVTQYELAATDTDLSQAGYEWAHDASLAKTGEKPNALLIGNEVPFQIAERVAEAMPEGKREVQIVVVPQLDPFTWLVGKLEISDSWFGSKEL